MLFNRNFAFFNFSLIYNVIQWEFYIFLSFHQFSMLFNRDFSYLFLVNFPCYLMGISYFFHFFINFPCYSMGILHFFNFPCYSMGTWGSKALAGGRTDGRTDGQRLLYSCVSATKNCFHLVFQLLVCCKTHCLLFYLDLLRPTFVVSFSTLFFSLFSLFF